MSGGLLFELLGQSVGDPHHNEDDVPIVLRSWTSLNFLITAMHVKGEIPNGLNVIGISEVQVMKPLGSVIFFILHYMTSVLQKLISEFRMRLFKSSGHGMSSWNMCIFNAL